MGGGHGTTQITCLACLGKSQCCGHDTAVVLGVLSPWEKLFFLAVGGLKRLGAGVEGRRGRCRRRGRCCGGNIALGTGGGERKGALPPEEFCAVRKGRCHRRVVSEQPPALAAGQGGASQLMALADGLPVQLESSVSTACGVHPCNWNPV
eukprot:365043-Chlamydomonas_euryale.AAC.9